MPGPQIQNNDFSDAIQRYGKGDITAPVSSDQELSARNSLDDMNHTTDNLIRIGENYIRNSDLDQAGQQKTSPDDLNQRFPGMKFTEPMHHQVAEDIYSYESRKKELQNVIDNGPQEFGTKLKNFGHNLLASALDPVNFAAGAVVAPIVGAAAGAVGMAEALGIDVAAPTFTSLATRSGIEAGLANIPATAADIGNKVSNQEHVDPASEMMSFAGNTMAAAFLFGGVHYGYKRLTVNPLEPIIPNPKTGLNRPFTPNEVEVIHKVAEGQIADGRPVNVKPLIKAIQSGKDIPNAVEVAKNVAAEQGSPENKLNYDPEVVKAIENKVRQESSLENKELEKQVQDAFKILKDKDLKGEEAKYFEKIQKFDEVSKLWSKIKDIAIDCVGTNA